MLVSFLIPVVQNAIALTVSMPVLNCNIVFAPPVKTVSNGLPPPDEPRSSLPVCVGLGVLVEDVVVTPPVSVRVTPPVASTSLEVLVIVAELSTLLVVDVVTVVELSMLLLDMDVVIVDELSAVLVIDVDVSGVWLGVKKVRVVDGFTVVEVTEVT
ncbi:hypothetical protein F5Y12DRAFT_707787 [Xylaria sp. FL1777]|nr:hypothetical protein F5Y12DRAFT_707787 [Xylaria sp. FL1777]